MNFKRYQYKEKNLHTGKPVGDLQGMFFCSTERKAKKLILEYECISQRKFDDHFSLFETKQNPKLKFCWVEETNKRITWESIVYVNTENNGFGADEARLVTVNYVLQDFGSPAHWEIYILGEKVIKLAAKVAKDNEIEKVKLIAEKETRKYLKHLLNKFV